MSPLLPLGAAGALALLVVAIRRPPLACGLLAVAIPLTAGMARGGAVPVLRVNEALLLVVAAGCTANWLASRRRLAFIGLDVVVLGFCLVGVVVPWAVILLSHAEADQTDWLLVLAPVQYLVVYLLFSRTEFTGADLNRLFNLCMLASLPVAAVAVAEALDLGGARDLVSAYYPTAAVPSWDTVYRPASLLGHYSALGAFGLLNFLLALALAATRHPGFSGRWLGVVMGANLLSVLASQTYAPVAALFPGAAAVVLGARRFPWRQAAAAPPVLAAAAVAFWPSISNRIASQAAAPGGSGLPETLQTRIDYWQAFFVPALLRHGLWFGTGTLMPPEVPRPLVDFVDNGYLWQLFRAGVPGLVVMIAMLASVAAAGWAARRSDAPSRRVVGLTCLGAVIAVVLMDITSEYLTFTAVSQEFWMLVGILAGFAGGWLPAGCAPRARLPSGAPGAVIVGAASRHRPALPAAALRLRRLLAPGGLLRSSAVLTLGNATARLLSLLFSVAAAKVVVSGFAVVSWAVSTAVLPRASRLAGAALRSYLLRALALTAAAVVPLLLMLGLAARPLVGLVFGSHYLDAGPPLALLAAGMAVYALYMVVESAWLGLGRPGVAAMAGGVGMTGVLLGGLMLIPRLGPTGAALAFGAGSVAQLVVLGALTVVSPRLRDGPGQPPASPEGARAMAEPAPAPRRPVLVMAEELTGASDDGYVRLVRTMAAGLGLRRPVVLHDMPGHRRGGRAGASIPVRTWQTLRAAARPDVRRASPAVVVYVSRSSVTVPALLRARLLKLVCRGVPVAVVGLHAASGRLPARFALRLLGPDLLLVPTGRERAAGRAAGVYADTVCGGVDLDRFRPPGPGERAHLRRRWRLPVRDRLILHVGHLREGRNLAALVSLAHSAGVTAVVAATGSRRSESKQLRLALESAGVVVIDGRRPNVEELYRLADCYVFPAVSPGDAVALPLSVLEALASDLPVVATRFGAVAERFGQAASVTLVDSPAEIPERALAACGSSARSRHLVEPYTWDALAERLAALLEEIEQGQGAGGAPASVVLAARLRRQAHGLRDLPRRLLWRRRPGYEVQRTSTVPVMPLEEPVPAPRLTRPRTASLGVVTPAGGSSLVAAAARLLGLSAEEADLPGTRSLLDRALLGRWELVAASAEAVPALSAAAGALAAYVGRGGTLYIDGLDERANLALPALGAQLGIALPAVRRALAARRLLLPAAPAGFAGALAGTALETSCGEHVLEASHPRDVRAWGVARGVRRALVNEVRLGRGRVVLSTLPRTRPDRPIDVLASPEAAGLVVPMLLLRQRYGRAAWHAPCAMANFTIDDPALRQGPLGLRYDILAAQARDHRFHVTIATVPRELPLADAAVVGRLRQQPELLSACYHGCDHDGYEFYLTAARRMRYPSRPLAEQRADLWRAVERGQRFASTHSCRLDRVMVFPHGVGPASLYPDLHRLGFLATCNFWDKYPLEAAVPAQADLGLRPADLAWEGFPLLWRRSIRDEGCLLDLLLGRPVLVFAHRHRLGRDFLPFVERAAAINKASRGTAAWCGLEEVARHAYLQRRAPGLGWEVLMTTNEACLHNPDPAPMTCMVTRPSLPHGSLLEAAGRRGPGPLRVTVPAGGTAVVRVTAGDRVSPLAGARRCSVVLGDRKEVCA